MPLAVNEGPTLSREEYRYFTLLRHAIEQLGGDPTAVTPSADLQATAAQRIAQVIVDPRTTLLQSLEAIRVDLQSSLLIERK